MLTVGYDVGGWQDEHGLAVRLADELGLERRSLIMNGADVPDLMRDTAIALEDPIHDPVTVPTLALSRAAAETSKVVLTGDGSDEFWGGYSRFDKVPESLPAYLERTMVFLPEELGLSEIPQTYLWDIAIPPEGSMSPLDRAMRLEVSNRMRNYHLGRVDKLSMDAGLEARSPFLDLTVTSLAESLPAHLKRPGERPKGLLIDAFSNDLPRWLVERRQATLHGPGAGVAHGCLEGVHFRSADRARFLRPQHRGSDPLAWRPQGGSPGRTAGDARLVATASRSLVP